MKPFLPRHGGLIAAISLTLTALLTPAAHGQTGNPEAGRLRAGNCAICHGPKGIAVAPDAPNLAGQNPMYTAAALKAYRNGTRRHEVMAVMAKPLSDQDIADLAEWYASIRVVLENN